jgi:hypothetical protein
MYAVLKIRVMHFQTLLTAAQTECLRTISNLLPSVTLLKEILLNSITNTFSFPEAFITSFGDN